MKVVILCGGQGTRMREETEYRPKPLVEIGGRPILWHIMKLYAWHGFSEFVLCLGYKGNMIKDYFLNFEAMDNDFTITLGKGARVCYNNGHREQEFKVTCADTGFSTLTGGRIKRVTPYLNDDLFMVTYGDGVSDVDIKQLLAFHRAHGKLATITATRLTSRFGVLDMNSQGQVRSFTEKPKLDGWISAGFFVFHRKFLEYLWDGDCILEDGPLDHLAEQGELMAYRHEGFFHPMDTYREYQYLNQLWSAGQAPWKVWQ